MKTNLSRFCLSTSYGRLCLPQASSKRLFTLPSKLFRGLFFWLISSWKQYRYYSIPPGRLQPVLRPAVQLPGFHLFCAEFLCSSRPPPLSRSVVFDPCAVSNGILRTAYGSLEAFWSHVPATHSLLITTSPFPIREVNPLPLILCRHTL